mgnify:CR=1 FL=1
MFKDTVVDFTYPKKLINSTIEGEFLEDFPHIKYKKVCIFTGSNASGKTALAKMMCAINNYLDGRSLENELLKLDDKICDIEENASFSVTFITPETEFIHKLEATFNKGGLLTEKYKKQKLKKSYSLQRTLAELNLKEMDFYYDKTKENHGIEHPQFKSVASIRGILIFDSNYWTYSFDEYGYKHSIESTSDLKLLETILMAFDPSIKAVLPIAESSNDSCIVKFSNGDEIIISNGEVKNTGRLSSGTLESITIANFIDEIIKSSRDNPYGSIFFMDEKMAHAHSEMEQSILNLAINKLGKNSQLFYTTHNYDMLAMNLPTHSYVFLKKDQFTEIIQPEKEGYTQNDRSLLSYVKNDVFGTLPNTSLIDDLL